MYKGGLTYQETVDLLHFGSSQVILHPLSEGRGNRLSIC